MRCIKLEKFLEKDRYMTAENWTQRYGEWAFIAGGSEGIGRSFARRLAQQGVNLVLIARKKDALDDTAEEIRQEYSVQVETHSLDLTTEDLADRLDAITAGREFGTLIYNAGAVHGASLFLDQPIERALNLIRLNCIGPVTLVHKLAPAMRAKRKGAVILVSSMSGLAGGGYIATYSASKAYEIAFTESMWAELGNDGVDILGLIAGSTRTPSMERAGLKYSPDKGTGSDSLDIIAMDPQDVADEAFAALGKTPIHVPGEANRASVEWLRQAPREDAISTMTSASANMFGLPALTRT